MDFLMIMKSFEVSRWKKFFTTCGIQGVKFDNGSDPCLQHKLIPGSQQPDPTCEIHMLLGSGRVTKHSCSRKLHNRYTQSSVVFFRSAP